MCVMSCCQEVARRYPTNYMLLFTFTAFEGVLIGFVSASYTWQSVVLAAGITVLIFLAMTVYAWNTTTDFTGLGPYIFAALMVFAAFGFTIMIMGMFGVYIQWLVMLYDAIG